jgi:DinB superfamily
MQETPQQYTKRILSYVQGKETLKVLASTSKQISSLLKGVRKTKLIKRPVEDKWSIAEILGHIADTEIVCSFRIRLILGSNGAPIQGFDQDVWAQYSNYKKQDPAVSLEAYRVNRLRNIHLLKSLPREMWDYYGMHSERGKETVTRVTEMLAGHDINHLNQIRLIIKGMAK